MKIRPVGAELFRTDRRADMTKLTVAFLNFANASKKWLFAVFVLHVYYLKILQRAAGSTPTV